MAGNRRWPHVAGRERCGADLAGFRRRRPKKKARRRLARRCPRSPRRGRVIGFEIVELAKAGSGDGPNTRRAEIRPGSASSSSAPRRRVRHPTLLRTSAHHRATKGPPRRPATLDAFQSSASRPTSRNLPKIVKRKGEGPYSPEQDWELTEVRPMGYSRVAAMSATSCKKSIEDWNELRHPISSGCSRRSAAAKSPGAAHGRTAKQPRGRSVGRRRARGSLSSGWEVIDRRRASMIFAARTGGGPGSRSARGVRAWRRFAD